MSSSSPVSSAAAASVPAPESPEERARHREVLEALSGLMLGMFVTILSSTVVATSLPRIIGDLGGDQSAYTWVVTASLLAMTVSTPIWGKFADLFDRKMLVQLGLIIFVAGSALCGLSQSSGELIAFRVIQGLGAGGLTALVQVVLADLISPRERGRYTGYLSAVMAIGTVGGPLLGGTITDTIGWRWNFYIGVPVAAIALAVLQRTLHLPKRPHRQVSIDFVGAGLLAAGISLLLIWVSLAGTNYPWMSETTALMVGGSVVLVALAVIVELRVREPILPMTLFRNRTVVFAVIASVVAGIAMFGTSVFLSQYMQLARGKSPTEAGLLTLPMVVGTMVSSLVIGRRISKTGVWKPYLVAASVILVVGMALMGTIHYDTSFILLYIYMFIIGIGVGVVMQNLVLIVQNSVALEHIGAASSVVTFFRSLGGAVGVSVLGAILGHRVAADVASGLASLGMPATSMGGTHAIPVISQLPPPVRLVVEKAYGSGVAEIFMVAAVISIVAAVAIVLLPNVELGTLSGAERQARMSTESDDTLSGNAISGDGTAGEPAGRRGASGAPAGVGLPTTNTTSPSTSPGR